MEKPRAMALSQEGNLKVIEPTLSSLQMKQLQPERLSALTQITQHRDGFSPWPSLLSFLLLCVCVCVCVKEMGGVYGFTNLIFTFPLL